MSEPKTAEEALQQWRDGNVYIGDDGGPSREDMQERAHKVVELAQKEGVPLEKLIQHPVHQGLIELEAEDYKKDLAQHHQGIGDDLGVHAEDDGWDTFFEEQ
jgi:hypothetical protein